MGNGSCIRPGDVQYMAAGTGVRHSEFNPSPDEAVHLLQIWIQPDIEGVTPRYAKDPSHGRRQKPGILSQARTGGTDQLRSIKMPTLWLARLDAGQHIDLRCRGPSGVGPCGRAM